MTKARLTFIKEEEDTWHALKTALKAQDLALCLWDMDQELRSLIKYQNKEQLQEARDLLWQLMENHAIDLDDLIY